MHRRDFIRTLSAAAALLLPGLDLLAQPAGSGAGECDIKDQLQRSRNPDLHYPNDIFLTAAQRPVLRQLQQRLLRLQRTVGHGNFALLGVDEMRAYGRNYPQVGPFAPEEMALLEQLFYTDAGSYGFFGEKPLSSLSATLRRHDLARQRGTGQYLYKGAAQQTYLKIKQVLGSELVLTSGVRGVVKQLHLFINKAVAFDGNLSLASRSLAPPGYSFHGIGDFDVGKRGWGARNFSAEFAHTEEFRRLADLGFVTMRYPEDNRLGVRYEPWHIKVVSA